MSFHENIVQLLYYVGGFIGLIVGIFIFKKWRKRRGERGLELQPLPMEFPKVATEEAAVYENVKAKIDLVTTRMDSVKVDIESIKERLNSIETLVKEIHKIAKS